MASFSIFDSIFYSFLTDFLTSAALDQSMISDNRSLTKQAPNFDWVTEREG